MHRDAQKDIDDLLFIANVHLDQGIKSIGDGFLRDASASLRAAVAKISDALRLLAENAISDRRDEEKA